MTFHFIGGEDHDFTKIGTCTVDTATTAARRTANARCSLKVGVSSATTDGWQTVLPSPIASCWLTARMYFANAFASSNCDLVSFLDGSVRRLSLRTKGDGKFELVKRNAAGTVTVLTTTSVGVTGATLQKIDINVVYGASGSVSVYLDGSLILSYTGDVTTDSASTLNGFVLGTMGAGTASATHWSEVICASEDTRAMNVVALPLAANGNAFTFDTGSYADIDETTLSDADMITSATPGQLAQVAINSSGITGTPAIRALCVSARAQKGGSGPQNVKMNVRTGGVDHLSATVALPAAMARVAHVFESNPGTSGPWGYTDLTAGGFNLGIQTET